MLTIYSREFDPVQKALHEVSKYLKPSPDAYYDNDASKILQGSPLPEKLADNLVTILYFVDGCFPR